MRVLIVSQRYPPTRLAGQELQAQLQASALARRGFDVQVLTTIGPGESEPPESSFPVTSVKVLGGPLRKVSQWWQIRRHLSATNYTPDIVHCHCISPTSLAAVQHFRHRDIPTLLQPSLGGPEGEFENARFLGVRRGIRRAILSATAYPVLDDVIREELLAMDISPERLFRIQNGLDRGLYRPVSYDEKRRLRASLDMPMGPIILFVGQLEVRKGLKDLLSIWPEIRASQTNASLVIIGTGTLDKRVRLLAHQDPSIRYLGVQLNVSPFMQAADVLVLPSYNESFGCVVTEALACGLPVVVTNTGIVRRLPIEGQAGRVVQAGKMSELTEALTDILADPEQRLRFKAYGVELAEAFDIEHVVDEVITMYRSIIH